MDDKNAKDIETQCKAVEKAAENVKNTAKAEKIMREKLNYINKKVDK